MKVKILVQIVVGVALVMIVPVVKGSDAVDAGEVGKTVVVVQGVLQNCTHFSFFLAFLWV